MTYNNTTYKSHLNESWFGRALPAIISSVPTEYTTIDIHHYDPTLLERISDSDIKTKLTDKDQQNPRVKSTFHRENIPLEIISKKHPDFKNYIIINGADILINTMKPKEFELSEDKSKLLLNAILVSKYYADYVFDNSSKKLFLVNPDGTVTTYLERLIIKKWDNRNIDTDIIINAYLKEKFPKPSNMNNNGYSKIRSDMYESIVKRNKDNNKIILDRNIENFFNKLWDEDFTYGDLIKKIKEEVIKEIG
jgi:hypothetical protein